MHELSAGWQVVLTPLAVAVGGSVNALVLYLVGRWTKRDNERNAAAIKSAIVDSAANAASKVQEVKTTLATTTTRLETKMDKVHQLVDGQKGILLDNLAAALEAN